MVKMSKCLALVKAHRTRLPAEHNGVIDTCQNDFLVSHSTVTKLGFGPNGTVEMRRVSVE